MTDTPQETATATAKTKSAAKTAAAQARTVYIGPNRPYDLPLMYNQICIGDGPPPFCADALTDRPHLRACFVPVADLGKALADLRNPKSDRAKAAAKVARETAELRTQAAKGGA